MADREETMSQINDPRMPAPDSCVVRAMLEKWVALQPDKVFVKLSKTEEVTYAQMRGLAERTAAGLHQLGVRQGQDRKSVV